MNEEAIDIDLTAVRQGRDKRSMSPLDTEWIWDQGLKNGNC